MMQALEQQRTSPPCDAGLGQVAELVVAARAGDRNAFGRLVERYQTSIYALALRRLGNASEAEELAQEVFVQALTKLHQLNEPASFGSWLRQIARRMAINRIVRRKPLVTAEPDLLDSARYETATPLGLALAAEQAGAVRCAVSRLRRMDREALEAFYVRGQSLIEMSDAFGSPIGTIKRRLHVARKRLARELAGNSAV